MFEENEKYWTEDWTIGGSIIYQVVERKENKIRLKEHLDNIDGVFQHDCGWYDILIDNGTEYVVLGSLYGHEHRLYAER